MLRLSTLILLEIVKQGAGFEGKKRPFYLIGFLLSSRMVSTMTGHPRFPVFQME